eukprot:g29127.t1
MCTDLTLPLQMLTKFVGKSHICRVPAKIAGYKKKSPDPGKVFLTGSGQSISHRRVKDKFTGSRQIFFRFREKSPGLGKNCRILRNLSGSRKCLMISYGPARRYTN